jgi:hypothetical protein
MTLAQLKNSTGSRNAYHTTVRSHARSVAEAAGLLKACHHCGYSAFVDCCHIMAVASFPVDSSLAVVNAKSNLVGLCPNHHKEFDNNLLPLS